MLPDVAKLKTLEECHPEYLELLPVWQRIDDIVVGSPAFLSKPQVYIGRRPGEDDELYRERLKKSSYTPVVMPAIRRLVSKLTSAPVTVSGIDKGAYPWSQLMTAMDGDRSDESQWLADVFKQLLLYGQISIAVDKHKSAARSRLESERQVPYCVVFPVETVRNWGDGWTLTRTIETRQLPLEEAQTFAVWRIWTNDETAVYECPIKLDRYGAIAKLKVADEWRPFKHDLNIPKSDASVPTQGICQLVTHRLPPGMRLGFDLYPKQIQHFVIESSWTEAGAVTGSVQRVFTPSAPVPTADPRTTYDKPDYSEVEFGNNHVLVGAGFRYEESTGAAISALTSQLETIERQIKTIAALDSGSVTLGAIEQSGKSKEIDQIALQESMRSYGSRVCQLYEDVLNVVAAMTRVSDRPSVTGLSEYTSDNLDSMLDGADSLLKIAAWLPNTALVVWFTKLSLLLVGTASPEQQEAIRAEMLAKDLQALATVETPQNSTVTTTLDTNDRTDNNANNTTSGNQP